MSPPCYSYNIFLYPTTLEGIPLLKGQLSTFEIFFKTVHQVTASVTYSTFKSFIKHWALRKLTGCEDNAGHKIR